MPQNPILVREKDGGMPVYMHTVDAAEGMRIGDYAPVAPDEEISPEQRASAMSRFKTGQATTHPEMQTEEEKAETRAAANEEAELLAGLPPGTPIVVQAPSDRPAQREARAAAQRARSQPDHPHGGPPGQTGEHPEHPHGGPPGQTGEHPSHPETPPPGTPEHPTAPPAPSHPTAPPPTPTPTPTSRRGSST